MKKQIFRYFRSLAAILDKTITVEEAINLAFGEDNEGNDCVESIFIAPPDPSILTDEDSGDEEDGGIIDNLSRRQLLADAEIRTARGILQEEAMDELPEDCVCPLNDRNESPAHVSKISDSRDWISGDFAYIEKSFPGPDYSSFQNKSIVEIFEMFLMNK